MSAITTAPCKVLQAKPPSPYAHRNDAIRKAHQAVRQPWTSTNPDSHSLHSLKSVQSYTSLVEHFNPLEDRSTQTSILPRPPDPCQRTEVHDANPLSGSESLPSSVNDCLTMSKMNQRPPSISSIDQSVPNPRSNPSSNPTSEYSAHSVKTNSAKSKNGTINIETSEPTLISRINWDSFKPTIDKSLLEPENPLTTNGYIQARPLRSLTKLLGSAGFQNPPNANGSSSIQRTPSHTHKYEPLFSLSGLESSSESDVFETPPMSPKTSSSSFDTGLTATEADTGPSFSPFGRGSEPPLHPTLQGSGSVQTHPSRPATSSEGPPNVIATRDICSILSLQLDDDGLLDDKESASEFSSLKRSESLYFLRLGIQEAPPPKGPVQSNSLLTASIDRAVSDASTAYDSRSWEENSNLSRASSNGSSSLSLPDALARRYAITIDAKNALVLRQAAILADIGLSLELLIPKINLYSMDKVRLMKVQQDLDDIWQECDSHQLSLPFGNLEWSRPANDPCGLPFVNEKRYHDFSWQESTAAVDEYSDAQAAALHFINDPAALFDNRLPRFRSQR